MNKMLPAISVIVPIYNAEKYIEPCLRSLINQTFKDFEAIVIDDASTDRSVEIVESLSNDFDGRLTLVKRAKNSGGMVAIPRNIGVGLATGKYIAFLDNDDMLTPTALAELHQIAEDTNADVLNASNFIKLEGDNAPHKTVSFERQTPVETITPIGDDLNQRVDDFIRLKFHFNVWTKLFRRQFIIENDISFPALPSSDDMFFSFCCLMAAKNYVRIPNAFYIWRVRGDSISHETLPPERDVQKWITVVVEGVKYLDEFMSRNDFFNQNPRRRFDVTDMFIRDQLHYLEHQYKATPVYVINELIRRELARHSTENKVLMSQLFSALNVSQMRLRAARLQVAQLKKQLEQAK